ncbi:MAG: flavin reductase family protein [Streptosporangiaceae bacterium]
MTRPAVSGDEFRHAIGHFATGVTVITSVGPGGEPVGTTASAVFSLSLDPPLILGLLRPGQPHAGGHPRPGRACGTSARPRPRPSRHSPARTGSRPAIRSSRTRP